MMALPCNLRAGLRGIASMLLNSQDAVFPVFLLPIPFLQVICSVFVSFFLYFFSLGTKFNFIGDGQSNLTGSVTSHFS
jgi:hypothetical protein